VRKHCAKLISFSHINGNLSVMSNQTNNPSVIEDVFREVMESEIFHSISTRLQVIQDNVLSFLLTRNDSDLLSILQTRDNPGKMPCQSIGVACMPLNVEIFRECKSEHVCKWMSENADMDDDGILEDYVDSLEMKKDETLYWKLSLGRSWLERWQNDFRYEDNDKHAEEIKMDDVDIEDDLTDDESNNPHEE